MRIHATCIAIEGRGVLLMGASGSGKSDLALRLIDRGAQLVSDDYTALEVVDGALIASPPETISGKLEVRGIGIVAHDYLPSVTVALIVVCDAPVPRMPLEPLFETLMGVAIRRCAIAALEPSAPIKLELMLSTYTKA